MELVVVLIGEKQKDWANIKKVIRGGIAPFPF